MIIIIDIHAKINTNKEPKLWLTTDYEEAGRLKALGKSVVLLNTTGELSHIPMDFPYVISLSEGISSVYDIEYSYYEKIWLRLNKLPLIISQDNGLRIRELCTDDAPFLACILQYDDISHCFSGSFEELACEYADVDYTTFVNYASNFISDYIESYYSLLDYGIWVVEQQMHSPSSWLSIGLAGFAPYVQEDSVSSNILNIGYALLPDYRHKGIATKACHLIVDYAKKELYFSHIQGVTAPFNKASINLLEKLGFLKTGYNKNQIVYTLQ